MAQRRRAPLITAFVFTLFFAAVSALQPRALHAEVFGPTVYELDNGLKVVVVENRRAPLVNHMVWYAVGSADEPAGKSGVAHFLEHLMFKGTDSVAPGEFSDVIAENGGRENAFTSWDFTGYFQTVAADRLELMMKFEADRMANLSVPPEEALPELDVIREERRSRTDNSPSAQLLEMRNAVSFLHHPYGRSIIGWDHEIAALTMEDVMSFYRTWYAPNNALLVVTGDVDPEEVLRLAEIYYGPIPARDVPERARLQEPPHNADARVEKSSSQVSLPTVSVTYRVPTYRTAQGSEAYALQLADRILGSGDTSRLYRAFVIDEAMATGAGTAYSAVSYDEDTFTFYVSGHADSDAGELERALMAKIEGIVEEGVTAEELELAKQRVKGAAVYANDSISTPGRVIGRGWAAGQSIEDIEAWPERIDAVTLEEVNAAIRNAFGGAYKTISVLTPDPTS